jgi:hypothetical protein
MLSNWQQSNLFPGRRAKLHLKFLPSKTKLKTQLMQSIFANKSPPTNRPVVKTETSGATAEVLQATPTGGIRILGGILTNSKLDTNPIETSRFACSAKSRIIAKRSVASASMPTSRVSTPMVTLSGPKSTLLLTLTQVRTPHQSSPLRIFNSELDGTPTSSSIRHSATNYESVYHLNCNL